MRITRAVNSTSLRRTSRVTEKTVVQTSVKLDGHTHRRLKNYAVIRRGSVYQQSQVICDAINFYLDHQLRLENETKNGKH